METTRTGNGLPENTGGGPGSFGASRHGDLLWLGVLAAAIGVYGVLVGAGRISAALWGTHLAPAHQYPSLLAIVAHFRNPSLAWQRGAFPTWLYMLTLVSMLVAIGSAVWFVARLVTQRRERRDEDVARRPGLASRREVLAVMGPRQLVKRANVLRKSVAKPTPQDLGSFLGTSCGVDCYMSVEDSCLIWGPPRSFKGLTLVVPSLLDWRGPVVTASTRPDNLALTLIARKALGPTFIFDPQNLAPGLVVEGDLKWSPISGCADPRVAMSRASVLCAGAAGDVHDGAFWQQQTEVVVRSLLMAAAVDGRTIRDVYAWGLSQSASREAVIILETSPLATPLWSRALDSVLSMDEKPRSSIWAMVATVFSPLADPTVLAALTPERDEAFDVKEFLQSNATCYLLSTANGASATANYVAALLESIVDEARRLAGISPGARLGAPLKVLIDEAGSFPLSSQSSLPSLMSDGGGSGISTTIVLQSLAQARFRWGQELAQAIFDSATAKIILGGGSSASDLADLVSLIGDRDVTEESVTHLADGGRSMSESTRQRPILDVATLRSLPRGTALLLMRTAKPVLLSLKPWTERRDANFIRANQYRIEELLRKGATERRRS
ncbi:MAG: TraM recognition domain-containing protein [Acidimicrobiaceae bacterium]|nr:TraM recognition domain-containing protein [Acidimicrobiaceae bacterium]